MSYAIVGILVIAFIAFVVLSAKAWHWSNIVFLSLCFLAGLGALISMADVLEKRRAVMLDFTKSEKDLTQVNQQIEKVLYGSELADEYSPDSLRGLSEALDLQMAGRGRVWNGGTIEASDANRIFRFPAERIQNEDAENQASMEDMRLFVFSDRVFEEEKVYPVVFVGTMRVVSETPDSVELEPVFIADENEYKSPTSTWTLFEKSPVDRRDVYVRNSGIVIDEKDSQLNDRLTEYHKLLVEQIMPPGLLGFDINDENQAAKYEQAIDRVLFDGLPIVKIENWIETQPNRISQRFVPEPEEIFVRFRFEKASRPYQVDSPGNLGAEGQFTKNGQAVNPALHAGGDIEFEKGDVIQVDKLTADGYQRGENVVPKFADIEPVTEIERVFIRRLKDFPYLLKTLRRQYDDYLDEIQRVQSNNQRSGDAIAKADSQAQERENQIQLLLEDQQKFQSDVEIVNRYLDGRRVRKSDLEANLQGLESEIRENHRKMKAISIVLDRSDSGTAQAGIPIGGSTIETIPAMELPLPGPPLMLPGTEAQSTIPAGQFITPEPVLAPPTGEFNEPFIPRSVGN